MGKDNNAEHLFNEIAAQLRDIEETTGESTTAIMDLAERQLDNLTQARRLIETAKTPKGREQLIGRMREVHGSLYNDLMSILTALNLHDLTVQRSRKISAALSSLRMMRGWNDDNAAAPLPAEPISRSTLKGPVRDVSQSSVDDLLTQLGS